MRTLLTSCTLALALCGPALLTSCGGGATTEQDANATYACPMHPEITGKAGDNCSKCGMPLERAKAAAEEHTYACPMHPEVTGKEGDKCSKCGMALEHNDNAMNMDHDAIGGMYKMAFSAEPAKPEMGEPALLKFTPQLPGQVGQPVPLEVVHEKKLHLIIVSKDLSLFDHVHPEYQADGSYTSSYTFLEGGEFLLYADYKPTGAGQNVEKIAVMVEGPVLPAKEIKAEQRTGKADGYEVAIDPSATITTGALQHFTARISKGGKDVDPNSVENYLGAKAHVVVIGAQDKDYLHVHPEVVDGAYDLHASFATPGFYKGWFQFQTGGKVHVVEFVLDVKQGEAGDGHADHDHGAEAHTQGDGHTDHDHGQEKEEHAN